MIRYGILCTASIVERYIQGIRNSKDGVVYAIASRTDEKAKQAAQRFGIDHWYGSYEALMQDENIDVVYIPTMNTLHYENAKMALGYHKNVVMEKPFVLDANEAKELFELAQKNHCFLMEAQKAVFLPTTIFAKELIEQKAIGDVVFVCTEQGYRSRFEIGHWMDYLEMGGGALNGSATYHIELMQYLFNQDTFAPHASFLPGPLSADWLVHFEYPIQDFLCSHTITMAANLNNHAIIYGTEGKIDIPNFWKADKLILQTSKETKTYEFPCPCEFVYQIDHINECLAQGCLTSPIMTPSKTIETIRMVQTMYKTYQPHKKAK